MNIGATIFICIVGGLMLCACSDNNIELAGESQGVMSGETMYLAVRLHDVDNSTRATSDVEFEEGDETEYAASDAHFYFYDASGNFINEGELLFSGEASNTTDQNIEFRSKSMIMLGGVDINNYPKYVVTVLSKPTDFQPGKTLSSMETLLADEDGDGIKQDGNFVMSTSSYYDSSRKYNFVTELNEDDFYPEPIISDLDDITPVDIYVERLAAKVTVNVGANMKQQQKTSEGNDHTLYEVDLSQTIYGLVDEDDGSAVDKVYVEFLGWKLNATARHSYMFKNINTNWLNSNSSANNNYIGSGWEWNDPDNFRCYWAKSYNYNISSSYPTSSKGNTSEEEADESTWLNNYLKYVNLENEADSPLKSIGDNDYYDYCAENTNTAGDYGIIQSKYSSAITSVLIKAKVCDESGNGLDLVRYNGVLFTKESYISYILNYLQINNLLNVYYFDDNNENKYDQIDESCVKLVDEGDGEAKVALDFENNTDKTFYEYSTDDGQGNEGDYYNEISNIEETYYIFDEEANFYNGGDMYYYIPIRHLNQNYNDNIVYQANYGVVRNHLYNVTINSLSNLGVGIFNPEEVIVPNPFTGSYYINAQIDILPWRVHEENVTFE
ncbi:MAG: Mfa1 family fimbria major subunit [Prevotella sp.]|nr:Mfa1 family fimbria major subunit [Prevotella sp.]